jgi:hypothetical protein
LEDFDEKPNGEEDLCVGLEKVRGGRTIHHDISASLVDEQVAQRDGGADEVLRERFPSLGGGGGDARRFR